MSKAHLIALLLFLVGMYTFYSYMRDVPKCLQFCGDLHRQILAGSADSPYRYRLFSAWLIDALGHPQTDLEIAYAYALAHLIALPALLFAEYAWLRYWVSDLAACIGALVLALYLPMMLETWGISLYSALEFLALCAALLLLTRSDRSTRFATTYAALVVLTTLNRETAIMLPIAYLAVEAPHFRARRYWFYGLLFGLCWLVPYGGMRLVLGAAPDTLTAAQTWANNTTQGWVKGEALLKNIFVLPLWVASFLVIRRAPPMLQRIVLVAVVYVPLMLIFGQWNEIRLQLPLFALLLPLLIDRLAPETPDGEQERGASPRFQSGSAARQSLAPPE